MVLRQSQTIVFTFMLKIQDLDGKFLTNTLVNFISVICRALITFYKLSLLIEFSFYLRFDEHAGVFEVKLPI